MSATLDEAKRGPETTGDHTGGAGGTPEGETWRFVTFRIDRELLGVRVGRVQEVLTSRPIASIPLLPPEIAGFINLRGQIVTAIDLRVRLALPPLDGDTTARRMNVVVNDGEEMVSLLVDRVGDVIDVRPDLMEPPPATIDQVWQQYCEGVFQLQRGLLVALELDRLLAIDVVEQ